MQLITKKIIKSDVYFLRVLKDYIVTNDGYDTIAVYDKNLKELKKIFVMEELIIDSSYSDGNRLLLFCDEKQCLVYIDIDTDEVQFICSPELGELILREGSYWEDQKIFLSNYKEEVFCVHLVTKEFELVEDVKPDAIQWQDTRIEKKDLAADCWNAHTFEVYGEYTAMIAEEKVWVLHAGAVHAERGCDYLVGKFVENHGEIALCLLKGLKSGVEVSVLEMYRLGELKKEDHLIPQKKNVYGKKSKFAMGYRLLPDNVSGDVNAAFSIWFKGKNICKVKKGGEKIKCVKDLLLLAEWFCENLESIFGYDPFPVPVAEGSAAEMISEGYEIWQTEKEDDYLWIGALGDWGNRHGMRHILMEWLPPIYFRRKGEMMEISWKTKEHRYAEEEFYLKEGCFEVALEKFREVCVAFLKGSLEEVEKEIKEKRRVARIREKLELFCM